MTGVLMLLGLLAACDEGAPPPTGSIEGTVSIGGTGTDGVTLTLSDGKTATTAGGGAYRFAGVEVGSYTVTISGYPSDAKFDATQASAVIATANQVVRLNFTGSYTSSIQGDVAIEGMPLPGGDGDAVGRHDDADECGRVVGIHGSAGRVVHSDDQRISV